MMIDPLIPQEDYLRTVLDAIPSMVVVMDRNLRILDANRAALQELGRGEMVFLRQMCGEILRCANLVGPEDECGEMVPCEECRIREATELSSTGIPVLRKHHRMDIRTDDGGIREVHYLISGTDFVYFDKTFVMIVIEDVTELMQLRTALPVCRFCCKVRTEGDSWIPLDTYLKEKPGTAPPDVCPACLAAGRA